MSPLPIISNDILLSILQKSKDATGIYTTKELLIQFANDSLLQLWGKDASIIGLPLEQALPELKGQPFIKILENVWETGEVYKATDTQATLEIDGIKVTSYFDFIYEPLKDLNGQVYCILHTTEDVTERFYAVELVREKQQKEQEINKALDALNEEYLAANEELTALNEEYQATNEELHEVNVKCEEIHDKLVYTENRVQQLVFTTPIGLALLKGESMIIETANPKILSIWGTMQIQAIGQPLLDVFPNLKDQQFSKMLNQAFLTKMPVLAKQVLNSMPNDQGLLTHYYLDLEFNPLHNTDGSVDAIMVTVIEVTERVLAAHKLQQQEIALQQANEELMVLNEEYQSTNEELATMNEEYTVTNEHLDLSIQGLEERNLELKVSHDTISELNKQLGDKEKHLQNILNTMAEGVGVIDLNGKLVYANPRAQEILGLTLSEIEDRTYDDPRWQNLRLDGTPLPQEEHPMFIMMSTGKPVYDHEIGVQPSDGRDCFYISINAAPIIDDNGNLTGGIGTFMDVTSRRLIAIGKDDFISIASHELKTPVTSLKASLQMLQRAHDTLPIISREKLINQSVKSLDNLSRLIINLLDTGRMTKGQMQMEKSTFSIQDLFNECCSNIVESARPKLEFTFDKQTQITADKQQIGQVMINFINNALKYAPDTDKIIIGAKNIGDSIEVSVSDFGPGIPKEKLLHLFERYYRTDYKGQKFSGLGLGLYISAEIIKNHDGQIGVDSEMGLGSKFWFTIPNS